MNIGDPLNQSIMYLDMCMLKCFEVAVMITVNFQSRQAKKAPTKNLPVISWRESYSIEK